MTFKVEHWCSMNGVVEKLNYDATAKQFVCPVCVEEVWVELDVEQPEPDPVISKSEQALQVALDEAKAILKVRAACGLKHAGPCNVACGY